jgi:hypothetical protein
VDEVELESSVIRSIAYDDDAQTCDVRFTSGRVYRYAGIPRSVFEWWSRTPEKGAFFNRKVRDAYPYRELHNAQSEAARDQDLEALLAASLSSTESDD